MSNTCEIIIYTTDKALSFQIIETTPDFQSTLAEALEQGTVVIDTVEGSRLILNAINVIAIEIRESSAGVKDLTSDTPPV